MKSGLSIDPTDILAIILMGLFAMRRINIRGTDPRAFPQVPIGAFREWQARADRAKSIAINICFAKFALNSLWFFVFGRRVIPPVLATGGWLLFLGWIGGMTYAWWLASAASNVAQVLGIVAGTRLPGGRIGRAEEGEATSVREEEEASSR
ncbi:MAG TPA: hypothetical protein VHU80_19175 [Polyangiaceae bacterium]|jgi:hypothetical protein|nr:hypothetical protein [Polyangiaceae bacterium]